MQDIDLQTMNNPNVITFSGFYLEVEINNIESRVGAYIKMLKTILAIVEELTSRVKTVT
jgi:hypothetical protein